MPKKKLKQKESILKGQIRKTFYKSLTFTAGVLSTGDKFTYKGLLEEGFKGEFIGNTVVDEKYGESFTISHIKRPLRELSTKVLAIFLEKMFKGIGPVKAIKLAELKEEIFKGKISTLVEKTGLKEPLIQEIQDSAHLYNTYGTLLEQGIALSYIEKLYKKYSDGILDIFRSNPYQLVQKIRGFSFKRIDQIALKLGIDPKSPIRIEKGIHYIIREAINAGNSYIPLESLIFNVNLLLHIDDINSIDIIKQYIKKLSDNNEIFIIKDFVSYNNILDRELYIRDYLLESECEVLTYDISKVPFNQLNEGQKDALNLFCQKKHCIISGPAGSGKTYLINSIVQLCKEKGLKFVLASTTGKAAKRMEQSCKYTAYTLHKLLKYNGVGFQYEKHSLKTDVLIIDEMSMAGIELIYNTLQLVSPNTKIVLIGDHNQLPSIEYGNVLKDLLKYTEVPHKVLDKCVRQAGELKENCLKILQGIVEPTSEAEIIPNFRPWYKITKYIKPEEIYEYIKKLYSDSIPNKLKLNPIRDVQLITPVHKGIIGTESLNNLIQSIIQGQNCSTILSGDKVMCTKNLYDIELMNGTQGYIIFKDTKNIVMRTFDDKEIKIPFKYFRYIQLAYALTVHKFQGDQIPFAIFICHKSHTFVHSCCMFYTAATRGMLSTAIIGDLWAITNCAKKVAPEMRQTFISGL